MHDEDHITSRIYLCFYLNEMNKKRKKNHLHEVTWNADKFYLLANL